jgi:arabinogalactan endo-1,4-beta-galactosidase
MQRVKTSVRRWNRMLITVAIGQLLAAYCLLPAAYGFHKFHASIAQIEYNAKEQAIEAVIRFFADDFETAISQHAKREIKFNTPQSLKDKANSEAVFSYVRERFELKGKNGIPVRLTWVGMELQADMVWVYVAGKLPGGLGGAQLRNRIMHELFDDQVNIVNFKYDGKQTGTMFNVQDGFKLVPDKK